MSFTLPTGPTFRPPRFPNVDERRRTETDELKARVATEAPRVPWDRFISRHFTWMKGEHVGLIGPTGLGKTTLMFEILKLRPFVAVVATKPDDKSMNRLLRAGYVKFPAWRPVDPVDTPRRVIWPDASEIDSEETQKEVFRDMFAHVYREGNWTIVVDELLFLTEELRMQRPVRVMYTQGRSLGISMVAATQRPARVGREIYDQSTHLFFWRDNDQGNIDRLAEINMGSKDLVRHMIPRLDEFQVLYINTRTGQMLRTRAPAPTER